MRRARVWLPLLCALLFAAPAAAQQEWPTAFVPRDHWSLDAARRLIALGLAPVGYDPARRVPTQREIGRLLEHAAARADASDALAALTRDLLTRYVAEFALPGEGPAERFAGSRIEAGHAATDGWQRTGYGYEDGHPLGDWIEPGAPSSWSGVAARASAQIHAHPRVAARVEAEHGRDDLEVTEAYAALDAGPVVFWGGRRGFSWVPGATSGMVIDRGRFDGGGVQTDAPFRMPWLLRHLGDVQLELALARHDFQQQCLAPEQGEEPRPCEGAWFLATRGTLAPHERISLGVTRAAFFGGDGNSSIDGFAIFSVLIGKHAGNESELDNQVVSVDAGYRLPTERWLPMRAYVEWGFEDSANAWRNVPGILAGIEVPALPGAPSVGVSVERVSFARSCCANPIWYRHSIFHDGWTQDARPLGHPLGGHGQEWSIEVEGVSLDARLIWAVGLFAGERELENLYHDARTGDHAGGTLRAALLITANVEAIGEYRREAGEGWREQVVALGLRAIP